MTKEYREKIIDIVEHALDKEDSEMLFKVSSLLAKIGETQQKLKEL